MEQLLDIWQLVDADSFLTPVPDYLVCPKKSSGSPKSLVSKREAKSRMVRMTSSRVFACNETVINVNQSHNPALSIYFDNKAGSASEHTKPAARRSFFNLICQFLWPA